MPEKGFVGVILTLLILTIIVGGILWVRYMMGYETNELIPEPISGKYLSFVAPDQDQYADQGDVQAALELVATHWVTDSQYLKIMAVTGSDTQKEIGIVDTKTFKSAHIVIHPSGALANSITHDGPIYLMKEFKPEIYNKSVAQNFYLHKLTGKEGGESYGMIESWKLNNFGTGDIQAFTPEGQYVVHSVYWLPLKRIGYYPR
jgi:hypothetical protein